MFAVDEAVPPVALLPYQAKVFPAIAVADNATAVAPEHTLTLLATGAAGIAPIVTVIFDLTLSQPVKAFA